MALGRKYTYNQSNAAMVVPSQIWNTTPHQLDEGREEETIKEQFTIIPILIL